MNYRHNYHAGNFADVFKHCSLILLIQSLCKKETAFCYLESHAGIGRYDLLSEASQKTQEYENGIAKIYLNQDCPAIIKTYQTIIQNNNLANEGWEYHFPHIYPGSPRIVKSLLRPQDRMILVELHPEDISLLKKEFKHDKQVIIHHQDGYQAINAFLPPQEKRGLILIDPSFEQKNEFNSIIETITIALKKFQQGIYAIWYPIKETQKINWFYRHLKKLPCNNLLITEFQLPKNLSLTGLSMCGMAIINTPWQFENELNTLLSWLSPALFDGKTKQYKIQWLIQPR